MRREDQPPDHIWLDSEALAMHFERLDAKYSSDSQGAGVEDIPADLEQNELTRGLRR